MPLSKVSTCNPSNTLQHAPLDSIQADATNTQHPGILTTPVTSLSYVPQPPRAQEPCSLPCLFPQRLSYTRGPHGRLRHSDEDHVPTP